MTFTQNTPEKTFATGKKAFKPFTFSVDDTPLTVVQKIPIPVMRRRVELKAALDRAEDDQKSEVYLDMFDLTKDSIMYVLDEESQKTFTSIYETNMDFQTLMEIFSWLEERLQAGEKKEPESSALPSRQTVTGIPSTGTVSPAVST